jgi:hypothetical protein
MSDQPTDTVTIQAQRWRGESLVRTAEKKRVLHRIGDWCVTSAEVGESWKYVVTHAPSGRRVPESGQRDLDAAKRHADACAVVFAGVDVTKLAENEDARALLREVVDVAKRSGDLSVSSKGG